MDNSVTRFDNEQALAREIRNPRHSPLLIFKDGQVKEQGVGNVSKKELLKRLDPLELSGFASVPPLFRFVWIFLISGGNFSEKFVDLTL